MNIPWRDLRHLKALCWMMVMVGMIESHNVHLNGFRVYMNSRAQFGAIPTVDGSSSGIKSIAMDSLSKLVHQILVIPV